MTWCCAGFQGHFSERHGRGSLVFARPRDNDPSQPSFYLAFRALEPERQKEYAAAIKGRLEGCMTLSCCTGMRFCPWCGVELREFYARGWKELVDEALIREFNVI